MGLLNKARGGRKNRKWGRNKAFCENYRKTHRREVNKLRRLNKHIVLCPNDSCAADAINRLNLLVKA